MPAPTPSSLDMDQCIQGAYEDATGRLRVDPGVINVTVNSSSTSGTPISVYNEVTNVALGATETVLTYIIPLGKSFSLNRINFSGDCIGTIEITFDSVINSKQRLTYTTFNIDIEYNGYSFSAGSTINITVTNNSRDFVASFNATLQGTLT